MSEKMYRFDFYKNRKIYFAISIALIVIGILCSVVMGPKLDIQFAGGAMVKYSVEGGDVTQEEVRQTIQDQLGKDCSVAINQEMCIRDSWSSAPMGFPGRWRKRSRPFPSPAWTPLALL